MGCIHVTPAEQVDLLQRVQGRDQRVQCVVFTRDQVLAAAIHMFTQVHEKTLAAASAAANVARRQESTRLRERDVA